MKCLALLLLLPGLAFGATIDKIDWIAPTQNVDGSPLTDLSSYNVYIGSATRTYITTIPILDPLATSALNLSFSLVGVLNGDQVFVAMTAVDSAGNESVFSNEVVKTVSVINIAPNAPAIITITISIGVDCPSGFTCTAN